MKEAEIQSKSHAPSTLKHTNEELDELTDDLIDAEELTRYISR